MSTPALASAPRAAAPGRSPRVTVAALALGQIVCWAALYYGFTSFVLPMQHATGWSKPELMGAFSSGLAMWGLCSYAVGAAIDRGRGRWVLCLGAALAGIGFLAWSRVASLAGLYAVWLLLGASMAMTLYEPAFSVLTKRYPRHYARGITALTLVAGFASTLSFPAVLWLVSALDWRSALAVTGAVLLCGVAPLHAWALAGPAFGEEWAPDAGSSSSAAPSAARGDATLAAALRQRCFWLLVAAFALYAFTAAALWAHLMSALAALGRTQAEAVAIVVWIGPAQVLGRLLHFTFGRHVGPRRLGFFVMAFMPVALLVLAGAHGIVAFLAFALLFGAVNGLVTIVRGTIIPAYFGRGHVGRISGLMAAIALLALAAAPIGAAWLLQLLGGYRAVLVALAGVALAAFACYATARAPPA
jgi:MFS family permease